MERSNIYIFEARCRQEYKGEDMKLTVGELYPIQTIDFQTFAVENEGHHNVDVRALAAYFCFYQEDSQALQPYISYDEFTFEKTDDGMEYFEEF